MSEFSPVFTPFPKLARMYSESDPVTITEKLDGTNSGIQINDGKVVAVQSRKRLISPEDDNYGFAAWVHDNEETLANDLGDGIHFGEWIVKGIRGGYGLSSPTLFLFNTLRWKDKEQKFTTPELAVVPELFRGYPRLESKWGHTLDELITSSLGYLEVNGSLVNPQIQPEGVVVYHKSDNVARKVIPHGWGKKGKPNKNLIPEYLVWKDGVA